MRRSLVLRVYPVYLVAIIAATASLTITSSRMFRDAFYSEKREELSNSALVVANVIAARSLDPDDVRGAVDSIGSGVPNRITVVALDGTVLGDSFANPALMENHATRPEVRSAVLDGMGADVRISATTATNSMYVAILVRDTDGLPAGIVRVAASMARIDARAAAVLRSMIVAATVIAGVTIVFTLLLIARIHRPLRAISLGAARYAAGDLQHRIFVDRGPDETRRIADALNGMAGQLSETIARITAQRNELEQVLAGMVEGVIVVDEQRRIRSINRAAAAMFGVSDGQLRTEAGILDALRNTDLDAVAERVLTGGSAVEETITLYGRQLTYLQVHGIALETDAGTSALLVLNDITRLRRLEDVRRDFVANVSHELKTPITAILGFVETLRDGAIREPESADRFLEITHAHADRLNLIVEDLLSLSRLESLDADIPLERHAVSEFVERAIEACGRLAAQSNTVVRAHHTGPPEAMVNRTLLEQALINLLNNAIKFSPPGTSVEIRSSVNAGLLEIAVADEGQGIPRKDIARVFERFYRVDRARSRAMGGTGLGLAIVKHVAIAHKGEVVVESVEGRGSTFTIRVPQTRPGRQ